MEGFRDGKRLTHRRSINSRHRVARAEKFVLPHLFNPGIRNGATIALWEGRAWLKDVVVEATADVHFGSLADMAQSY